jgi:CRP/FNR family transcriptional regulator, cyclic AMP receptor protein
MSRHFRIIRRSNDSTIWTGVPIHTPYGLEIIENCVTCPHREDRLFCNLSPEAVAELSKITAASAYPKGATLFMEGQPVRGVFIICSGSVKLSTSSADGKTLIVRIADPGEVLGLAATVTGKPYELTADVIEPAQANFISRADFLAFLTSHGEVALRVAQQMGGIYHSAIAEMRSIGLSHSASKDEPRATLSMTHEEIAQIIGASRETVTRLFTDFKKKRYLQVHGSMLILRDKPALEKLAGVA